MTYNTIIQIASSNTLIGRIAAAAADQDVAGDPMVWAQAHRWELASSPGWAAAWESALASDTLDNNPDTGARPGVITDGMILSAVQAEIAAP